jgi:hypothetical protein
MCGISSIYKDNYIEDAATVAAYTISNNIAGEEKKTINRIEVYT